MNPTDFTRLESAYENDCAWMYSQYLDELEESERLEEIEQEFWNELNCTASALHCAEIVQVLQLLRNGYCAEPIGAAHKALIKADMNKAIGFAMHAHFEFCQSIREEAQQYTRSNPP